MSKNTEFRLGQYFIAPLRSQGFAYGYFTYVDDNMMRLCAVHDLIGDKPELPDGIDTVPLVLNDLRIGGSEFTLGRKDPERYGRKWLLMDQVARDPVKPTTPYFLMGRDVIDIYDPAYRRPATESELKTLEHLGHPFPPVTVNTIEIALRRIDANPHKFKPADYPLN